MKKIGFILIIIQIILLAVVYYLCQLNFDLTTITEILKCVAVFLPGLTAIILLTISYVKTLPDGKDRLQIIVLVSIALVVTIAVSYYAYTNSGIYTVCTKLTRASNMTTKTSYKIYAKNSEVQKIIIDENVQTYSSKNLEDVLSQVEKTYKTYHEQVGSYDYTISRNGPNGKVRVIIDYNKMNIEKYIEYNPDAKDKLNSNNRYTVTTIKQLYTEMGAKCK